jgi:AbrB family looped-hinge helix DNA binding protein
MSRVTSKLQVTIPKAIADQYGIEPGSEIEFLPAGEAIRVVPPADDRPRRDLARRLELFDAATARERDRRTNEPARPESASRGWTREQLYDRDRPR